MGGNSIFAQRVCVCVRFLFYCPAIAPLQNPYLALLRFA